MTQCDNGRAPGGAGLAVATVRCAVCRLLMVVAQAALVPAMALAGWCEALARRLRRWADDAEIDSMLALVERRMLRERARRCGRRCGEGGVCRHEHGCHDLSCPGRPPVWRVED